ncbi:MAG: protein rep, partial [Spirochaetes bacterium]|nr:protein rep [Spirochaetota bacterium]
GARGGWGEFEKKVERYGKARARAEKMAEYLLSITSGKYQGTKLKQCGTWLRLRHYYTQGDTRVVDANFCHQDRLCPLCAIRRGAKFLKAYVEKFMALDAQGVKFLPHMVNHTVKDGEDLKERVDHLVRGLRAIRQRVKDAQRGKCQTEASKALGAVYSIEIKKGEGSHIWHPHAHSIWPCTSLLDVEKLKGEWEEITGDSHQVYAEPFHCVGSGLPVGFESLAGDLAEVFKYALKFSSMTLEDQWLAYWILKRRRLVASWGILYGVKVPENLLDDVTESELPYIEFLLRFVSESGYELEEYSQS